MKKKKNKRPPMTEEEKIERQKLRDSLKGQLSEKALYAIGNRGQPPSKYTPEFLEELAQELDEWSKHEDSCFFGEFCLKHTDDLDEEKFFKLAEKSEVFETTLKRVKERLVMNFDKKALSRKYDASYAAKIKPLFDMKYREWCMLLARIEGEASKAQQVQFVITPGGAHPVEAKTIDPQKKAVEYVQGQE